MSNDIIVCGKLFHACGPAKARARLPNSDRGFGTTRFLADEKRSHCLAATAVTGIHSSARYDGARLCMALYTMRHSLKSMHYGTRSQWRSCRTSDMWSNFLRREMTLTAAFMTCWRRFRLKSGNPAKMQLQLSILDNTALLISILEASVVSERLMARACLSALKHAPVSLAMCGCSDRSRSITTPRFRTDVAGLMVAFPIMNELSSMRWSLRWYTTRTLFLPDLVLVGLNTSIPRCWRYRTCGVMKQMCVARAATDEYLCVISIEMLWQSTMRY